MRWRSRRKRELDFRFEWGALANYNAEKARGLVHSAQWRSKMAEKQAEWNAKQRAASE